jgi:hypothetical protein
MIRKKKAAKTLKTSKPQKIRIKEKNLVSDVGVEYSLFLDIPNELIPTSDDVGKLVEVAGSEHRKEEFILRSVDDNSFTLITEQGQFRSFYKEAVILHRDEERRVGKIVPEYIRKKRQKAKEKVTRKTIGK